MDLAWSCREKLMSLRIQELKYVLTELGLSKQGRKQDLVDRIMASVSDDQVSNAHTSTRRNCRGKEATVQSRNDTHRMMQSPRATPLESEAKNYNSISSCLKKDDADEFNKKLDTKMRCLCRRSLMNNSMIKCEDARCSVWQHISCVITPEKPSEGLEPKIPSQFYCEICRVKRADPFWATIRDFVYPVKLVESNQIGENGIPAQSVDMLFNLTGRDIELLHQSDCHILVWCILLNDEVPFRIQWPQYANLVVNGERFTPTDRPGCKFLGINGRDDCVAITTFCKEGFNRVILSGCDTRSFCVGVRIAQRRTIQQVLNQVTKEGDGERLEESLARVCRCIGGGNAGDNADGDSDLEFNVTEPITVNLRCPVSGSRIKTAARFKPCNHMGCFDLETFVKMNEQSRKWQCPNCLKNYALEHIIIDPYFGRIASMMRSCGEDVTEILVKPDGIWRVKNEITEQRDLMQWHKPDGSLCASESNVDMKLEEQSSKEMKQKTSPDAARISSKLTLKRNRDGVWVLSKPENLPKVSSSDQNGHKVVLNTSSSEDNSVNQDDKRGSKRVKRVS